MKALFSSGRHSAVRRRTVAPHNFYFLSDVCQKEVSIFFLFLFHLIAVNCPFNEKPLAGLAAGYFKSPECDKSHLKEKNKRFELPA